jgi:hypothetical protein
MTEAKHELVIEIDPGPGPWTGHVRDEHDERYPFSGWVGFAAALGRALGEDAGEATRRSSASTP